MGTVSRKTAEELERGDERAIALEMSRLALAEAAPVESPITGTSGDDTLIGTSGDDEIDGLAGNDRIEGREGHDLLDGGDGRDWLYGGTGNDQLLGGNEDDVLYGEEGGDILRGGGGNDHLYDSSTSSAAEPESHSLFGEAGDDYLYIDLTANRQDAALLDGGIGNDRITVNAWHEAPILSILGGDGNDTIGIVGGRAIEVDAGAGNDEIRFNYSNQATSYQFSLGAGADILLVRRTGLNQSSADVVIRIKDFEAGSGGDRLVAEHIMGFFLNWDLVTNPFATGHFALEQRGSDAVLRIDFNGGADGLHDFAVLENVDAASLTGANLGFSPDGGLTASLDQDGTANPDLLLGAGGADQLRGLDGDDELSGGSGNDRLDGGRGADRLDGGFGDDILVGGDGDDQLSDRGAGDDQLFGGEGADRLEVVQTSLQPATNVLLDGGAGNDQLRFGVASDYFQQRGSVDNVSLIGGDGDDSFWVYRAASATIDAGMGNDRLSIGDGATAYLISLGAGADAMDLWGVRQPGGSIAITDFEAGDAGDRLDLEVLLDNSLIGWDSRTNPFDTGHLRVVQRGADAVLQIDRDAAAAAAHGFADLIIFQGIGAGSLTSFNLGGYRTFTGGDGNDVLEGDAGNNTMRGNGGDDVLVGKDGDDILDGGTGADRMEGGYGNDLYFVDDEGDVVVEVESSHPFFGTDEVRTSLASYTATASVERLVGTSNAGQTLIGSGQSITIEAGGGNDIIRAVAGTTLVLARDGNDHVEGGSDDDGIYGGAGSDTLLGGDGDDFLDGGSQILAPGDDHIEGGAGHDRLRGGRGNDTLLGGTGNDDLLDGEGGADMLDGGEGDDLLFVARGPTDPAGTVTLVGGIGNDNIRFNAESTGAFFAEGGDGDDTITFLRFSGTATITLGAGADVIAFSNYQPHIDPRGKITITDFDLAAGGDRLDLGAFLQAWLIGWDPSTNPFASGHLGLARSGTSTLLLLDRDGSAGTAHGFITRLTFLGTQPENFTADHLGFAPQGAIGLAGTDGADNINGTDGDDILLGLGGNDSIDAKGGDDEVDGGDGDDRLDGGGGNDVVRGGAGNDKLRTSSDSSSPEPEYSRLYGEDGDDDLYADLRNNKANIVLLDGGAGSDTITFYAWYFTQALTIAGGDGNDIIDIEGGRTISVDAGAGADRISFDYSTAISAAAFTLGAGADLLFFRSDALILSTAPFSVRVTDFQVGPAGDRLVLDSIIDLLTGWDRVSNPLASGHFVLLQRGTDTVLQVDFDGDGNGLQDFVILQNVDAATLTHHNIGFAPNGGTAPALSLDGSAGSDLLLGWDGADLLRGLEGDDDLRGGLGDDRLEGGAGRDILDGGFGSDVLAGDAGSDQLSDFFGGNDQLFGGDGHDKLEVHRAYEDAASTILMDGGAGDDDFLFGARYDAASRPRIDDLTLVGGAGHDWFYISGARTANIDAGEGNDTLEVDVVGTANIISLGAGADIVEIGASSRTGTVAIRIADFETGAAGDRLDLGDYLEYMLPSWDRVTNPFDLGHLQLIQRGADAVLRIDVDGAGIGAAIDLVIFEQVNIGSLTTFNLGGYATFLGTAGDDLLEGDSGNNTLRGLDGNDTLNGNAGDDLLDGGAGDDVMTGGSGNDRYIVTDPGDQVIEAASAFPNPLAWDEVRTSLTTYAMPDNVERVIGTSDSGQTLASSHGGWIAGAAGADVIRFTGTEAGGASGGAGDDRIEGGSGNDSLFGDFGFDTIFGGDGNDQLYAGDPYTAPTAAGGDYLDGGAGNDGLQGSRGNDVLVGGSGDDKLSDTETGADRLDGGDGNDSFSVFRNQYGPVETVTVLGGTGNDTVALGIGRRSTILVDAGEGADTIDIYSFGGTAAITLGAGADVVGFSDFMPSVESPGLITIADFDLGAGGDRLSIGAFLQAWLIGWDPTDNPFETGHLRLARSGSSTLLQIDRDGSAGTVDSFFTSLTFLETRPEDLTADHLGFAPAGTIALAGSDGADSVTGTAGNDILLGLAGNDVLDGGTGDDLMEGGAGDDAYYLDSPNDRVVERPNEGRDILHTSFSYALAENSEIEDLAARGESGSAQIDFSGNSRANLLAGNAGANELHGGGGDDILIGRAGDDLLVGGAGADAMDGGAGNDIFHVDALSDRVTERTGEGRDVVHASASYRLAADSEIEVLAAVSELGQNPISLAGNDFANALIGNAGANQLRGEGGDDSLVGLGGNDVLIGGGGVDGMAGGQGDDSYYVDNLYDRVTEEAGEGRDVVYASASYRLGDGIHVEVLATISEAGLDPINLVGNDFANFLLGNAGSNRLNGGEGDDSLIGLSGNDELIGGGGVDAMDGGGGSDSYYVDSLYDRVTERANQGRDVVYASVSYRLSEDAEIETLATIWEAGIDAINLVGNGFANFLVGNAGANRLNGSAGDDSLVGLGGNDELIGGSGVDAMDGGLGDDVYYVDSLYDRVTERAGGGRDVVYASASYRLDETAQVEVLATTWEAGTEAINLVGNSLSNFLIGNAGANRLNGGSGDDVLVGLGGNDELIGGSGIDAMDGGDGDDSYYVDNTADRITERANQGRDIVYASIDYRLDEAAAVEVLATISETAADGIALTGNGFANRLIGNAGTNALSGGGGDDVLIGLGGNDILTGGAGADAMYGGLHDDAYYVDDMQDQVTERENEGLDIVYAGVSYRLAEGVEVETLAAISEAGTDPIDLVGNSVSGLIIGNAGSNLLDGGIGADILIGLGGADRFAFTSTLILWDVDTIRDFQTGVDQILLDDAIFTGLALGTLAPGAFAIGAIAADADDRILYDTASGALFFDPDGSGATAAIQFAVLSGTSAPNLTASDILVI